MFKILVQKIYEPQRQKWLELPLDWSEIEGYLSEMVDEFDPDEQDIYDLQENFDIVKVEHDYPTLDYYWKDKIGSVINFNEIAEQLENMDDNEYNWFLAYYCKYSTKHIIDILDTYQQFSKYWGNKPITDVAKEVVNNRYGDELTEFTRKYFNYAKYGQYLLNSKFCKTPYGILELM